MNFGISRYGHSLTFSLAQELTPTSSNAISISLAKSNITIGYKMKQFLESFQTTFVRHFWVRTIDSISHFILTTSFSYQERE